VHNRQPIRCCSIHECLSASIHSVTLSIGSLGNLRSSKNYTDNLSGETKKGMLEKARQGIWPSYAPLGYLNVMGADGKRTIAPSPELAPIIQRMFERYATGKHSLNELAKLARQDGLQYPKSKLPGTVHARGAARKTLLGAAPEADLAEGRPGMDRHRIAREPPR